MIKIFHDGDGGLFGVCMSSQIHDPHDPDIEAAMRDAEYAFANAMDQAARTICNDGEAEEILASLIGAWKCVKRARSAAGQ